MAINQLDSVSPSGKDELNVLCNGNMSGTDDGNSSETTENNSRWGFKFCKLTVEPVLFAIFLAQSLTDAVVTNLFLARTCEIELKYNHSVCSALGTNTAEGHEIETLVQPQAAVLIMGKTLLSCILPAIMSLSLGPWSDYNGRRLLLLSPICGLMLMYLMLTVISYLPNLHPAYILLTTIPLALSGGYISVITAAYCYVSDVSTEEDRSLRMGFLEGMLFAGLIVGVYSTSFIYNAGGEFGYLVIFSIAAVICFLTFIYTYFCVPETVSRSEESSGFKGIFSTELVKEMLTTCFKKRENSQRAVIFLTMLSLALTIFLSEGVAAVSFLYVRVHFGWNLQSYTIWYGVHLIISVIGTIVGCGVFGKYMKISDTVLGMIAYVMKAFEFVLYALIPSNASYVMYLGGLVAFLGGVVGPVSRSLLSKSVPKEELGKVFSLTSSIESLSPIAASPVFTLIYNSTLTVLPSAFLLFTAVIYFLNFIFFTIMAFFLRTRANVTYETLQTEADA